MLTSWLGLILDVLLEESDEDWVLEGRGVRKNEVLCRVKLLGETRVDLVVGLVVSLEFTSNLNSRESDVLDRVLLDVDLLTFVELFPVGLDVGVLFELGSDDHLFVA